MLDILRDDESMFSAERGRRIHRSVPENTMPETRTFESRKNLTEIAFDELP